MKFYRQGDRSAGVCEQCHVRVTTRMEYRDYTPPGWDVPVPEVLVAVCERCDHVVGIPHQSTPRINASRKEKPEPRATVTVEARVPREIEEALNLVTVRLGGSASTTQSTLLRYYLRQMATHPALAEAARRKLEAQVVGPSDRRISLKLAPGQWASVQSAARGAGIARKSDVIRAAALLAAEDWWIGLGGPAGPIDDGGARKRRSFLKRLVEIL